MCIFCCGDINASEEVYQIAVNTPLSHPRGATHLTMPGLVTGVHLFIFTNKTHVYNLYHSALASQMLSRIVCLMEDPTINSTSALPTVARNLTPKKEHFL